MSGGLLVPIVVFVCPVFSVTGAIGDRVSQGPSQGGLKRSEVQGSSRRQTNNNQRARVASLLLVVNQLQSVDSLKAGVVRFVTMAGEQLLQDVANRLRVLSIQSTNASNSG